MRGTITRFVRVIKVVVSGKRPLWFSALRKLIDLHFILIDQEWLFFVSPIATAKRVIRKGVQSML